MGLEDGTVEGACWNINEQLVLFLNQKKKE